MNDKEFDKMFHKFMYEQMYNKDNLTKHDGKYISSDTCDFDNPFEFLNWLKKHGDQDTLDCGFDKLEDENCTLFYGEYNGDFEDEEMVFEDFAYLIYDEKMLNELQTIIDIMLGFETND